MFKKKMISIAATIGLLLTMAVVPAAAATLPTLSGTLTDDGVLTITVNNINAAQYPQVNIVAKNNTQESPDIDPGTGLSVPTMDTIQVGVDQGNSIQFKNRKGKSYHVTARLKNPDGSDGAELAPIDVSSYVGITYNAQVQNVGWMDFVRDGAPAGTEGRSLRVEGFHIKLDGSYPPGAKITVQAHVQNKGWMDPVSDGNTIIGTVHESLRVEALKITLSGMPGYSVTYRAHVQNESWMPWQTTANGTSINDAGIAGTSGRSLRIEAVQIKLVKNP